MYNHTVLASSLMSLLAAQLLHSQVSLVFEQLCQFALQGLDSTPQLTQAFIFQTDLSASAEQQGLHVKHIRHQLLEAGHTQTSVHAQGMYIAVLILMRRHTQTTSVAIFCIASLLLGALGSSLGAAARAVVNLWTSVSCRCACKPHQPQHVLFVDPACHSQRIQECMYWLQGALHHKLSSRVNTVALFASCSTSKLMPSQGYTHLSLIVPPHDLQACLPLFQPVAQHLTLAGALLKQQP